MIPLGYTQAAGQSKLSAPSSLPLPLTIIGDVIPAAYYQRVNGILSSAFKKPKSQQYSPLQVQKGGP
jgi:hypothetical protein